MIFPIELLAHETPHYTSSPYGYRDVFRDAFIAANPKGSYYAFDVTINSPTEVGFVAYDMRDNVSGGIGKQIWSGSAVVPRDLTADDIDRAVILAATDRRAHDLAVIEAAIIRKYADEIHAKLIELYGEKK